MEGRSTNTAGRYYRCTANRTDGEVPESHADCWEIPCDEVDEAVWAEVKKLMSDKDKLRRLVGESLGTVPQRAESYRRRLAELDEQIEKKRASRNPGVSPSDAWPMAHPVWASLIYSVLIIVKFRTPAVRKYRSATA